MKESIDRIVCPLKETGPGNLRNSEGSVIELKDGKLLLAYTHFYADADDSGVGDIRGKISGDGGERWSKPFVLRPNTARYNTGRLSLFRVPLYPTGVYEKSELLGIIWVELNLPPDNRLFFATSQDEGKTWSRETPINQTGRHFCMRNDTVTVLSSGRILVPAYSTVAGMCSSLMYYSDDRGMTWNRSHSEISIKLLEGSLAFAYADFEEPAVVELSDGGLLCFGRTRLGELYRSFSKDGGVTWDEPGPTGLASSYSPASLKKIPGTGYILCVWNQASGKEIAAGLGRMRLSCAISKDDGKSWTHFQNLESLDNRTRIEPERDTTDAVSEIRAIKARRALSARVTQSRYPKEVTKRYPEWPGYVHNEYPFVTFTSTGNVVICYSVSDYEIAGLPIGLKCVVRPIDWLYGRK